MKRTVHVTELIQSVRTSLDCLLEESETKKKSERVSKWGKDTYLYKYFRFHFEDNNCDVRYIRVDRDDFLVVYQFDKKRTIKSYFYKTSLLLNGQVDIFCKLCVNELESRG